MNNPGYPIEVRDVVSAEVRGFADNLIASRRLAAPLILESVPVAEATAEHLDDALVVLADVGGFDAFVHWTVYWIRQFGRQANTSAARLKMVHARRPMCPRFHTDNVHMRLICTLTGPGSEWLPAQDVKFLPNGHIGQGPYDGVVRQLYPGSVGFFKGTAGSSVLSTGVVHRSPAEETDRLILTMDMAQ